MLISFTRYEVGYISYQRPGFDTKHLFTADLPVVERVIVTKHMLSKLKFQLVVMVHHWCSLHMISHSYRLYRGLRNESSLTTSVTHTQQEKSRYKSCSFQKMFISVGVNQKSFGENIATMNFGLIFVMLFACISATRLGFHGSIYKYSNVRSLSPKQVAAIKKLLKQKCIQTYGNRFC